MPRPPLTEKFALIAGRLRPALALVILAAAALACNLGAQSAANVQITATVSGQTAVAQSNAPQIQIKSPADNSEAVVNRELEIYVRATDSVGVTRVELRADDLLVDSSASPDPNGSATLDTLLYWTPTTSGPHVLQIVAFRGTVQGDSQTLHITVRDNAAQVTVPAVSPVFVTSVPSSNGSTDLTCRVQANVGTLNVRSGPGINYDAIGTISIGQPVPVTGSNADQSWWQVNAGGTTGWVSAAFSSTVGVCSNVFVIAVPPSPTLLPNATPIYIPPSFTPIPALPTVVPSPTIRVVVLPTLTFTPGPSGPSAGQLTATAILATQTALAIPTIPPTSTLVGLPPASITTTSTALPTQALVNLAITNITVNPPTGAVLFDPAQGVVTAMVYITVANFGSVPAPLFRIAVQQGGTLTFANTTVPLLPNTQITTIIPTYITHPGTIPITAIVDYDNVIIETSKADNTQQFNINAVQVTPVPNAPTITPTLTYTPPPPTPTPTPLPPTATPTIPGQTLPILAVTGIDVSPDPVQLNPAAPSTSAQVNVIVANLGNAPAASFNVTIALPGGAVYSGQTAGVLAPGAKITVPISVPFSQAGTIHLVATADPKQLIPQSDRSQNIFGRDLLVTGTSSQPTATGTLSPTPIQQIVLPVLIIKGIQVNTQITILSVTTFPSTVQVAVTVGNVGNGPANPFLVSVVNGSGETFSVHTTKQLPPAGEIVVDVPIIVKSPGKLSFTVFLNTDNAIAVNGASPSQVFSVTVNGPGSMPTPTLTFTPVPIQSTVPVTPVTATATKLLIIGTTTSTTTATSTPIAVKASSTATNTATSTSTSTRTPGLTAAAATATRTNTAVPNQPTLTRTNTATSTATSTITRTPSLVAAGATATRTNTAAPNQPTPTRTNTATSTATSTQTLAPTANQPSATHTPTSTPTFTATFAAVAQIATRTATSTVTRTNTSAPVLPSATSTSTITPLPPTATHTATPLPPTATHTVVPPTATPTATHTPTPLPPTATHTATPLPPTATHTLTPLPPTATHTPTPLPPTATHTPTPLPPTATHTATPLPPTATHTPTPLPPTATHTPTPLPPTATHTLTPLPPTATHTVVPPTATPTATVTLPPAQVTVTAQTGAAPDFNTLPIVPDFGNDPALLAAVKALGAKASTVQPPPVPAVFAVVGDNGLADVKAIKPEQVKLDQLEVALRPALTFFTPGFATSASLPTTSANLTLAELLDPAKAEGACKDKNAAAPKSMLLCALENNHARIVLLAVGQTDIARGTPVDQFQATLQQAVDVIEQHGAVPVLVTIAGASDASKIAAYNLAIYNVAKGKQVPLFNLFRALNVAGANPPLLNAQGQPTTGGTLPGINFAPDGLKFGVNVANLQTIELLDALLKALS